MNNNASSENNNNSQNSNTLPITLIVATAFFMELFDSTVIVTALPKMAETFGTSAVRLSLGLTAYMLATAVFLPASGWIADRYGTRQVFGVATLMFLLTSLWCGLSRSVEEFIIARTLQGISGAMMSPVGRLVVLRTTPRAQLVRIMNLLIIPALIGPVLGPPIGGLITTYASWRWVFFINIPIGLVGVFFVYRYIPNLFSAKPRPFDGGGFVLNGMALSMLIYGMDRIAERGPGGWIGAALVALGLIFGAAAVAHARRHAHPLMPLTVARIHTFAVSNLSGGAIYRMSISAPLFLLPLLLQIGLGMSAFASGLLILLHTTGDLLMKLVATRLLKHFNFRSTLIWSAAIYAISMGSCALFAAGTPYWLMGIPLFVSGAFRSLQMTALNSLQFADVQAHQMTDAATLSGVAQQIQRAVGVALGAVILNFALMLRGAAPGALVMFDFQVALVLMSTMAIGAIIFYWPLTHDSGAELMGRKINSAPPVAE